MKKLPLAIVTQVPLGQSTDISFANIHPEEKGWKKGNYIAREDLSIT